MSRRIVVFALILALLPCALAAGGLEEWVLKYNLLAAEAGAPALNAANARMAAEGTYEFQLESGIWFGVILSPDGSSQAVFAQAFENEDALLSLMSAAASNTDTSLRPDETRARLKALLQSGLPVNMDVNGRFCYLVARDAGFGVGIAVYDAEMQSSPAMPDFPPAAEDDEGDEDDFWDGLWDDEGEKDAPAPTLPPESSPTDRIIYKIESRKYGRPEWRPALL